MLGNIGPMEMIFIFLVLLLVFGARRIPEIGSGLGKGIREFKRSMTDIQHEISRPDNKQPEVPPARPTAAVPPASESVEKEPVNRDAGQS
jgi:sec-independent protein translocase protein TatA